MNRSDLSIPIACGVVLGIFLAACMRRGHILPAALNWGRSMPSPALLRTHFERPRFGMVDGFRAIYCESDAEIADLLTDKAPSWWWDSSDKPITQEDGA